MYDILLYVGVFLIVSGGMLFIVSEMNIRRLDREQWKNEQLIKSFNRAKQKE